MSITPGPGRAVPQDGRDLGSSSRQRPDEWPGPPEQPQSAVGHVAAVLAVLLFAGILLAGLTSMVAVRSGPYFGGHAPFFAQQAGPFSGQPGGMRGPGFQGPDGFQPYAPGQSPVPPDLPGILLAGMLGAAAAAGGGSAAIAYRRRRRSVAEWVAVIGTRFDAVREEYGAYQMDLLAVLDRPALADSSVPQTAAFITAYGVAQDTERLVRTTRNGQTITAYETAVRDLEQAWRVAREYAERVGVDAIPAPERSKVTRAMNALHLALAGGSPAERRAAYQTAIRLIRQVVSVPQLAISAIEADQRLSLTTGGPPGTP